MNSQKDIESKINTIFKDQFDDEILEWDKKWSDYNFSSIQLVYFLKDLEHEFGAIPIAEFYDLQTGRDLVVYLSKRV